MGTGYVPEHAPILAGIAFSSPSTASRSGWTIPYDHGFFAGPLWKLVRRESGPKTLIPQAGSREGWARKPGVFWHTASWPKEHLGLGAVEALKGYTITHLGCRTGVPDSLGYCFLGLRRSKFLFSSRPQDTGESFRKNSAALIGGSKEVEG